jgi:hypothetical protein
MKKRGAEGILMRISREIWYKIGDTSYPAKRKWEEMRKRRSFLAWGSGFLWYKTESQALDSLNAMTISSGSAAFGAIGHNN